MTELQKAIDLIRAHDTIIAEGIGADVWQAITKLIELEAVNKKLKTQLILSEYGDVVEMLQGDIREFKARIKELEEEKPYVNFEDELSRRLLAGWVRLPTAAVIVAAEKMDGLISTLRSIEENSRDPASCAIAGEALNRMGENKMLDSNIMWRPVFNSKFGQWRICHNGGCEVGETSIIATVHTSLDEETDEKTAHLIASAPYLLVALEEAVWRHEDGQQGYQLHPENYERAKQAIKRSKGEI